MKHKKKIKKALKKVIEALEQTIALNEITVEKIKVTPIKDFKIIINGEELYDDKFLPSDNVKNAIIFDYINKIKESNLIKNLEQSKIDMLEEK